MEQAIDVRAIRAKLGLTQIQFGDMVGVDQSTISNWENGMQPRGPARKLLEKLASDLPPSEQENAESPSPECPGGAGGPKTGSASSSSTSRLSEDAA